MSGLLAILSAIPVAAIVYLGFLANRKYSNLSRFVTNVTAPQALKLINENKNMLILDVRTKDEFKSGHIKGAILIPYNELERRIIEIEKYKDKPTLVYCQSGRRGSIAVNTLIKNGFIDIYHLYKGFSSWPYEVVK
ncbi:sulfurtransferase [Fervidicella metallireducens AeB]|uniref:Sulfurtransferase n=1 Tax=Fervidicella metallireducens AeB TaxID=1403537 RepID=A0A017RVI5_9CLOT|nr:rhodanese-like domain-containing protein [Fervidicella metallireducens]EYE88692.1 sulfurtransferase [Fervidicella metallireducens AeB]